MKKSSKKVKSKAAGASNVNDSELTLGKVKKLKPIALAKLLAGLTDKERQMVEGIDLESMAAAAPSNVPGSPPEPVYEDTEQEDIQGNIIPGFNKSHQHFLFFGCGKRRHTKIFIRWLVPLLRLSSMKKVMRFRKEYRERRLKLGKANTFMAETWVNIAFSYRGIAKLTKKATADKFWDPSFKLGLAARSTYLGDPSARGARGHESNWKVGGSDNEADLVVMVASDRPRDLKHMIYLIKHKSEKAGMPLLFEQGGKSLPEPFAGHEHFGFKDGVSQPGVRGKLSRKPGDYITPRYIADSDDRRLHFAKPGQLLVWPGQFLMGEPRQSTERLLTKETPPQNFPKWAALGSYLVLRRLRQDVPSFWGFVNECAKEMGVDPVLFATKLVGRWPSGAPIMRSPNTDDADLGADEFANNHFLFDNDTLASKLKPIPGYPGDRFSQAQADFLAKVCPHFAHIRKVNPRDSVTDLGKPEDNLARFILRRGIPYGEPLVGERRLTNKQCAADRGLMFLCFGSSIENQFEFLQRRWANSASQPNLGGHDPLIGQNGATRSRERFIEFPNKKGGATRIEFEVDFVVPTGGGYFFAPTISAIQDVLGK